MTWKITLTLDNGDTALDAYLYLRFTYGTDVVGVEHVEDVQLELEAEDLVPLERVEPDPAPPAGIERPLTLRSPRDVACPRCGATAGNWCTTPTGTEYGPSFFHDARKQVR